MIGIVSRFVDQKGFDLIAEMAADLMEEDLAIVALGTGQPEYEELFRALRRNIPAEWRLKIGYDNALAHKIEAGADMFLMPSRYEPCGLKSDLQLAIRTVPVVRATGGLDDTVQNFDPETEQGTGFKFEAYDGPALLAASAAALKPIGMQKLWRACRRTAWPRISPGRLPRLPM